MPIDENLIQQKLATRDLSVDFVRVLAIILVVILHTMMVGLTVTNEGLVQTNPLEHLPWFPVASWFGQIMPLFFVAGGFASWIAYDSLQKKGRTPQDFIRGRAIRLIYPVSIFYGAFFVIVSLAHVVFGLPIGLLNMFLTGVGLPIWFIVAYMITQAFAPFMIEGHKKHPYMTLVFLFAGVVIVDTIRLTTGQDWVGWFNLFFVWSLIQQFGFFIASPLKHLNKPTVVVMTVLGFVATWASTLVGYNPNMLANLNPPMLPLIFIGIGQTGLFLLLRPYIQKVMKWKPLRNFVLLVGTRSMTIYLWHLPIIVLLSALVIVFPTVIPMPADGAIWWISRFAILIPASILIFFLTLWLAKYEVGPKVNPAPGYATLSVAILLALFPAFIATISGLDYPQVVWGSVLFGLSVVILVGRKPKQVETVTE